MADTIETQARKALCDLESIVTAVESLGNISVELSAENHEAYGYLAYFLGSQLQREFQAFHTVISHRVLPLVADISSVNLS